MKRRLFDKESETGRPFASRLSLPQQHVCKRTYYITWLSRNVASLRLWRKRRKTRQMELVVTESAVYGKYGTMLQVADAF